tara:strand:+ start:542 stop:1609 length:1068 start_codon:yes stop_codon:yes gene_type:complete
MKKNLLLIILIYFNQILFSQCDSAYTIYTDFPSNVTILSGDSCLYDDDIAVLDSLIIINNLNYNSPLNLGTQTWFNGRLRFLVAGNYGNSSGVNDTIYFLPDNIGNWSDLSSLYLEWNRISELPESFSRLVNLQSFYINNNVLISLGDSIGNLSNLYFLDLGYNKISNLPESICNLENLSYLWLFNNNLESLPECLCDMGLDWNNNDAGGYPYFAIGANSLCDNVISCIAQSNHFELSLDQFYYSFPVSSPQNCDMSSTQFQKYLFPYKYQVSTPYPNPFNPIMNINLLVPHERKIDIRIYDLIGNEIDVISNSEIYEIGYHTITWSCNKYSSGIYYIIFNDKKDIIIRKIILIK